MKVSKILLCIIVSPVSSGFAQAESGESAKAGSGLRFMEAPQTGNVRGTFVAGSFSNQKRSALAPASVKTVSDRGGVPAPSKQPASTGSRAGATVVGAGVGATLGLCVATIFGMPVLPAMLLGAVFMGGLVRRLE
ncbi:MAG: hypothetical protein AAB036_06315 [Elusimicrobiota bacterium]|mgnify:CR=1 FL=1